MSALAMVVPGARAGWLRRPISAILAAPGCLCLWSAFLPAQEVCDPNLQVSETNQLGYRLHGDRCEGLFVQQVAGSFQLASLHLAPKDFTPEIGKTVRLSWPMASTAEVRIRAVSLRPKTYYRMDSVRRERSGVYQWSMDLLRAVGLSGKEIGLLAWAEMPIGGQVHRVYSPVSVDGRSGELQMILLADVELDEVSLSLVKLDEQGRPGNYVFSNRALKRNYYPARQPITASLPRLQEKGFYRLEIAATFKNGGSATPDVYFISPGDR